MNDPRNPGCDPHISLVATVTGEGVPEQVGAVIGPYKLMEQIGEGGFGLVFVAEQQYPVRRKVALKVIKPGMDTRDVIARFEAERQALALMDHPNIARVLDAGATDSGRPYFVMEFVRGISITDYCDQNRLTPRERLELFVAVCQAVQHAHQKGIIHRDIKPSNVLVTLHDGRPMVKVIDFGVAKALHQSLTEKTIYTRFAQMVGTPLYMSPEQAEMSGLDIDTRTDIYSLGVLMYELLTGTTPFDKKRLAKAAYDELIRIIREEEPPKPSTRLSHSTDSLPAIAAHRKTEPARLSKMFRGDLDWITMKALEKDRTRRYETASGLAADVLRYLYDEPVEASPPSTGYRLKKLARRHRTALVTATAFVALLIAAVIVSTWLAFREKSARDAADRNATMAARSAERAATAKQLAENSRQAETDARSKAETERDAKDRALQRAEGLRLTAQSSASLPSNPGLALLLAIEGAQRSRPRLATHNDALLAALTQCRERRTILASALDPDTRPQHGVVFTSLSISHDGRRFATTSVPQSVAGSGRSFISKDNAARVWNAETGAPVSSFRAVGLVPTTVEFSPDDRFAVTTFEGAARIKFEDGARHIYSDRAARVWDASTGLEVAVLRGHTNRVISAHFSPDGGRIVTASWDNTARVWDARTGRSLSSLPCGRFALASAVFSPDGTRILTVSSAAERPTKPVSKTDQDVEWDPPLRRQRCEVTRLTLDASWGFNPFGPGYSAVRLWDAVAGKGAGPAFHILGDKIDAGAVCAAFSPNSKYVATGQWLGTVKVWDAQKGTVSRSWKRLGEKINSVAYSPDGNRLLLIYGDAMQNQNSLAVWNAIDGKEIVRWGDEKFPTGIRTAQFSPNGGQVLVLPGNELQRPQDKWRSASVSLCDVGGLFGHSSDDEVATFKGHEANIAAAQFNLDGREAVTAGADGTLRIWTCRGTRDYGTVLRGSSGPIGLAAFSPNGHSVLTTYGLDRKGGINEERSVRLWNAQSGKFLHALKPDLPRHQGPASVALFGVLQSFVDPTRVADMPLNAVIEEMILGEVLHAEFSRDGRRLLTVSDDSHVRRHVDASPNDQKKAQDDVPGTPLERLRSGTDVAYAPVRVWDVEIGKKLMQVRGFSAGVRSASLSPDGRRIVTVADNTCKYVTLDQKDGFRMMGTVNPPPKDPAVRIWDAETGKQVSALVGPANRAYGATWSPDGNVLVTAILDLTNTTRIQLWNGQDLTRVRELATKPNRALGWEAGRLVFAPDSRHVMMLRTDDDSKLATIWDVEHGKEGIELHGHDGRVNGGTFSPNGRCMVTASDDRTARVWNVATGEQLLVLRGHDNGVHSARFSPDGQWIVTASDDTTARVWYAETGREYCTLSGHRGPVFEASFSPDSQSVVTASGDGTARIWPIDPLPVAISRKPRDLTHREREIFEVGL
jgi:WD40 repeat protein/serine/threonine protein kinase